MKKLLLIFSLLISVAFAQSKAGFYLVGGKVITVQDTASRKYLKAIENAGVVPTVIQNVASNYLVTTEKAIGSYSLIVAQYPYIGGTAATHKFNLNNPLDTDGAFRLTYSGTITHSALGIQGDGSSGFVDTKVNHSTNLTDGNQGISVYLNTNYKSANSLDVAIDIGVTPLNNDRFFYIAPRFTDEFSYYDNRISGITSGNSGGSSIGVFTGSTFGGNVVLFKNGVKIAATAKTGVLTGINHNIYLMARNDAGSALYFSPRRQAYSAIHQGFTDDISIKQSRIITFFNSILGRQ